ncbi:hypothetical protein [Deinococcus roseus]|uniref:Uncharacterized protein n=1 Tax=Deinococcus roseus TaxID=392414 RepID=A0ABQ2CWC1_9DEIO|nr:hypothetical protein [Deinococcus roseus]GGJ27280.1 hypothetical protein GCM10008938_11740 [Deinococcus roseus]
MAKSSALKARCKLCGQDVSYGQLTRHLQKCVPDHPPASKGKPEPIRVVRLSASGMFLVLELPAKSKFFDLDDALRAIWLECCGHMSMFTVRENGEKVMYTADAEGGDSEGFYGWLPREKPMSSRIADVLQVGVKGEYEYDMGSTTHLKLQVLFEHMAPWPRGKPKVRLLARNLKPEYACDTCGQPAVHACAECVMEEGDFQRLKLFCQEHAEQHIADEHEDDDCVLMPLGNSPRDGVCGYEGTEEDELPYVWT